MRRVRFADLPIRHKLLAMGLLPLLVVLPLLGAILLVWGDAAVDRLLITKVRSDLAVARGYFDRVLGEVGAGTRAVAESHALNDALEAGDGVALVALLGGHKQRHGVEFLNLLTPTGELAATEHGIAAPGPAPPRFALDAGNEQASVARLDAAQFALIAPALRERLGIALVPTRGAAPDERTHEDRALLLVARAPVLKDGGSLIGYVQGGVLLNRNLPLIDHINDIVYPKGALPFGSVGTATLFLDDVRISTNVRLFGPERDERAIGTRVSQAVREAVLGRGDMWLDRAFVVNDWYVSAYEALVDGTGQRVGMLYVGYLERPFRWLKYGALASIGAVFLAVMVAAAWLSLRWARSIFAPLERMTRTMQRVEGGALDARVGAVAGRDEIGRLAGHLDQLLDVIGENTRELDRKVAERTRELQASNASLRAAQQQLVKSEKLAAIGQLTASIAHEVNNPIAVIQGNLDLVRELLGERAESVRPELKLVDAQVERMRLIVTRLLQFARPTEYAGYVEPVDIGGVVDDCLLLVGHLSAKTRIEVRRELQATRRPVINRQELQQVLINLIVNAIQAMPDGGRLTLASRDRDDAGGVAIDVTDSGPGLTPDIEATLFQPFVTTKTEGTGLGLWISRSLVERYGGDIIARNGESGGAVFTILLLDQTPADLTP